MKIHGQALGAHLKKNLSPLYLITGDETVLINEACDLIRDTAKKAGFIDKIRFVADRHFSWETVYQETRTYSLFSDKKILDIDCPSLNFNAEAKKILEEIATSPPGDLIILLKTSKLSGGVAQSRWIKAFDKNGVIVQIWPLEKRLNAWLKEKALEIGLNITSDAIQLISERLENNALAAKQSLEKLSLIYGSEKVDINQIKNFIHQDPLFDPFKWVDVLLQNKTKSALSILKSLKERGEAPILILWAIARELRLLIQIQYHLKKDPKGLGRIMQEKGVWSSRQSLIQSAIQKKNSDFYLARLSDCHKLDALVKGEKKGNIWQELSQFCLNFR